VRSLRMMTTTTARLVPRYCSGMAPYTSAQTGPGAAAGDDPSE
jgi:hypothetical protein